MVPWPFVFRLRRCRFWCLNEQVMGWQVNVPARTFAAAGGSSPSRFRLVLSSNLFFIDALDSSDIASRMRPFFFSAWGQRSGSQHLQKYLSTHENVLLAEQVSLEHGIPGEKFLACLAVKWVVHIDIPGKWIFLGLGVKRLLAQQLRISIYHTPPLLLPLIALPVLVTTLRIRCNISCPVIIKT